MPRKALVEVTGEQWVELTDADASRITIIHRGGGQIYLEGSTSATAPTTDYALGIPLKRDAENAYGFLNYFLTDMFPDISAPVRVFARTDGTQATVLVRHA